MKDFKNLLNSGSLFKIFNSDHNLSSFRIIIKYIDGKEYLKFFSQERWLDQNGRVVAIRYWNGTALVLNVTG